VKSRRRYSFLVSVIIFVCVSLLHYIVDPIKDNVNYAYQNSTEPKSV